ncbi:hypothetical protein VT98_10661, partial [Candidatus Electrothrix communis]
CWELVEANPNECPFTAPVADWDAPTAPYQPWNIVKGDTKLQQYSNYQGGSSICVPTDYNPYGLCEDYIPSSSSYYYRESCMPDWCEYTAPKPFLQDDISYQIGGVCSYVSFGHCLSQPDGFLGCGASQWMHTINVYKWKCNP